MHLCLNCVYINDHSLAVERSCHSDSHALCSSCLSEDRRVMVIGMFFFSVLFFILVCLVQQKQLSAASKVQEGNTMF